MASRRYTSLPYIDKPVAAGNFTAFSRAPIDHVIIHTTVGTADGSASWFNNPQAGSSAHYIIRKDGVIYAMLEEYNIAHHAGNWEMNRRSIGIEHTDDGQPNAVRPDALYKTSAALVRDICQFYGIPIDRTRIRKHSEVTSSSTACPGTLDIDRIVREAKGSTPPAMSDAEKIAKLKEHIWYNNAWWGSLYRVKEMRKVLPN